MNNLQSLNEKLFSLFDKVESGEIDPTVARELNNTASIIVKNTKTQLDAVKSFDTYGCIPQGIIDQTTTLSSDKKPQQLPQPKVPAPVLPSSKQLRADQDAFAKTIGYDNYLDAITKLKVKGFNKLFKNRNNKQS